MDLETENQIAAILLKEAAELRRQAEKDGVHAYLNKPGVRARPNSRFLTATVLGVQQANRAVEVNELWRVRQKEKDLEGRLKGELNGGHSLESSRGGIKKRGSDSRSSCQREAERYKEDEGLGDDELEDFLHSKVKRGRGSVGPRMDETGPYPASCRDSESWVRSEPECRALIGPEKPSHQKCKESCQHKAKVKGYMASDCSDRRHSRKQRYRDRCMDKKEDRRHRH